MNKVYIGLQRTHIQNTHDFKLKSILFTYYQKPRLFFDMFYDCFYFESTGIRRRAQCVTSKSMVTENVLL